MSRFIFLGLLLLGVAVSSPTAAALPPTCSTHYGGGCWGDWYADDGIGLVVGPGRLVTTCVGGYFHVSTGYGACGDRAA